jgi:hypothetical protein
LAISKKPTSLSIADRRFKRAPSDFVQALLHRQVHPSQASIAHMMNSDIDSIQDTPAIPPNKGSVLDEPERPSFNLLASTSKTKPLPQTKEYSGGSEDVLTSKVNDRTKALHCLFLSM